MNPQNPNVLNWIFKSSKNKILLVSHQRFCCALTAKGVNYFPKLESSIFSPYELDGGYHFRNCEVFPCHIVSDDLEDLK